MNRANAIGPTGWRYAAARMLRVVAAALGTVTTVLSLPAHAQEWVKDMPTVAQVLEAVPAPDDGDPAVLGARQVGTLMSLRHLLVLRARALNPGGGIADAQALFAVYEDVERKLSERVARCSSAQSLYFRNCRPGDLRCVRDSFKIDWQLTYSNSAAWRERVWAKLFSKPQLDAHMDLMKAEFNRKPYLGATIDEAFSKAFAQPPAPAVCGVPETITLVKATTRDAQSIDITYKLDAASPGGMIGPRQPVKVRVHRSGEPVVNARSVDMGTDTIVIPASAKPGEPITATILNGRYLTQEPNLPFVIVALEGQPGSQTVQFRKHLLGVVIHGFSFNCWNTPGDLTQLFLGAQDPLLLSRSLLLDEKEVARWQSGMLAQLRTNACYHPSSLPLIWQFDSTEPQPELTTHHGRRLFDLIADRARAIVNPQTGDVVDVHLIGHSRGAIVASKALIEWGKRKASTPQLSGSAVRVTMLDAHPANNHPPMQIDFKDDVMGNLSFEVYTKFQDLAKDPLPVMPAGVGIQEIGVWYQQNTIAAIESALKQPEKKGFCDYFLPMNMWGLGNARTRRFLQENNHSGVSLQYREVTVNARGETVTHGSIVDRYSELLGPAAGANASPGDPASGTCRKPPT